MFESIPFLTLIVAGVVNVLLGFVWYAQPVFGARWAREAKITFNPQAPDFTQNMIRGVVGGFLASLLAAYVLWSGLVLLGVETYGSGVVLAGTIWLGFMAPQALSPYFWEQKSLLYVGINAGYQLVSVVLMALVLITLS